MSAPTIEEIRDLVDAYRTVAQCPGVNLGNGDVSGCACGGGCNGSCDCPSCATVARLFEVPA